MYAVLTKSAHRKYETKIMLCEFSAIMESKEEQNCMDYKIHQYLYLTRVYHSPIKTWEKGKERNPNIHSSAPFRNTWWHEVNFKSQ